MPLKVTDPVKSKWNRLFILAQVQAVILSYEQTWWQILCSDDKTLGKHSAIRWKRSAERVVYLFYTRVLPDVVVFGEI